MEQAGTGQINLGPAHSLAAIDLLPDILQSSMMFTASAAIPPADEQHPKSPSLEHAEHIARAVLRQSRETPNSEGAFNLTCRRVAHCVLWLCHCALRPPFPSHPPCSHQPSHHTFPRALT